MYFQFLVDLFIIVKVYRYQVSFEGGECYGVIEYVLFEVYQVIFVFFEDYYLVRGVRSRRFFYVNFFVEFSEFVRRY